MSRLYTHILLYPPVLFPQCLAYFPAQALSIHTEDPSPRCVMSKGSTHGLRCDTKLWLKQLETLRIPFDVSPGPWSAWVGHSQVSFLLLPWPWSNGNWAWSRLDVTP